MRVLREMLRPGLLVSDGGTLLRVNRVYPAAITAEVLLGPDGTPPRRTSIRRLDDAAIAGLDVPTEAQVGRYQLAYGNPLGASRG